LQSRLANAFQLLVSDQGLELSDTRTNRSAFEKNFGAFLMDVRGFLIRK
jgi:hypothetical protein